MKTWQSIIIGVFIGLIMGGAIYLVASPKHNPKIEFIAPTQVTTVVVSILGEVNHPGLYSLGLDSRINDALQAAGGTLPDADLQTIDLAKTLADGEQIYVPRLDEKPTSEPVETQGKININQATLAELDVLPGIGAEKAQAIIDYRNKYGNFQSIEDLLYVPGIGPSILSSIRDMIDVK
jgi:competence protein ComEA